MEGMFSYTLRAQAHTRTTAQPQPPSRLLFLRCLQPFAAPDPLHSILAHRHPATTPRCAGGRSAHTSPPGPRSPASTRLRPWAAAASSVVSLATAAPLGTPAAHLLHAPREHAPRRSSGLRSFPPQYPSGSVCPTTAPPPAASTCRFLFPVPSAASPGPSSNRRTPSASGRTPGW